MRLLTSVVLLEMTACRIVLSVSPQVALKGMSCTLKRATCLAALPTLDRTGIQELPSFHITRVERLELSIAAS